jgi:hypothetical protein
MNKTASLVLAAALVATLAACGSSNHDSASPAVSSAAPSYVESAPPVETDAPATEVDYRKDVTALKAVAASKADFPEGNTADVSLTITNHGTEAATYEIVIGVYDSSKAQVGAILVSTAASEYGPTKAGGTLKVTGPYGMDGGKLPEPFTVEVQSVDRVAA